MSWPAAKTRRLGKRVRLSIPLLERLARPASQPWLTVSASSRTPSRATLNQGAHNRVLFQFLSAICPQREMVLAARTHVPPSVCHTLSPRSAISGWRLARQRIAHSRAFALGAHRSWRVYGTMFPFSPRCLCCWELRSDFDAVIAALCRPCARRKSAPHGHGLSREHYGDVFRQGMRQLLMVSPSRMVRKLEGA